MNQSILASIRAYLDEDHTEWDKYLSEIECSLRSSVHSAIGVTPYFALFRMNMLSHGSLYYIARKLSLLTDCENTIIPKSVKMDLVRKKIRKSLHKTYLKNERTYNKRCRKIKFISGQEVFRRSFVQSEFKNNFNAKLERKFFFFFLVRTVGSSLYEVENLRGKSLELYHGKDLKQ